MPMIRRVRLTRSLHVSLQRHTSLRVSALHDTTGQDVSYHGPPHVHTPGVGCRHRLAYNHPKILAKATLSPSPGQRLARSTSLVLVRKSYQHGQGRCPTAWKRCTADLPIFHQRLLQPRRLVRFRSMALWSRLTGHFLARNGT
jgi:hypothetical protein